MINMHLTSDAKKTSIVESTFFDEQPAANSVPNEHQKRYIIS